MKIEEYKDLAPLTTFHIPARARWYAEYESEDELLKLSRSQEFLNNEILSLGAGSNLLFVNDFHGMVIRSRIMGIQLYEKDADHLFVIAGAGVTWTDLVDWCIDRNLAGLENMAGIPGTVGASAVQNVGAYGREAKDVIHAVKCFDTLTHKSCRFTNEECRFGYRDSFFKHQGKNRYIVTQVSYRVTRDNVARHLDYRPLREYVEQLGRDATLRELADKVIALRNSKLPDPAVVGSAGSFFKNPVLSGYLVREINKAMGIEVPGHPVGDDGALKVSAAWLIDQSGMKGVKEGGAQVWPGQPLVIANVDHATANDVAVLAERVRAAVRRKFRIELKPEVNYIDDSINVTVLGSGTSKGVPEVGCDCDVCRSDDPRDKRMRASILVRTHGMNLLIDPSPDFRTQALQNKIYDIDAVLITHSHYDHVGGIDDLRPFCATEDLPMYVRKDVDADLRRRLDYCFREHPYPGVPVFDMRVIDNYPFYIKGLKIEPVEVLHGSKPIYGYRIGRFAYITDAKTIPDREKEKLEDLDVLIVNALRYREHFAHFSISEALALIEELKPREAYLTHLCHDAGKHADLSATLPPNVHVAFDGLKITSTF